MPALVLPILAALPQVMTGAQHLIAFLREARAAGQQTGEWTPEMDAQFEAELARRAHDPAWQPDRK